MVLTTIDIYSHITDTMQLQAANKIECGIGNSEAYAPHETIYDQVPAERAKPPQIAKFEPYKGKIRKSGTGDIYEINNHLMKDGIRQPMYTENVRCITYMPRFAKNVKNYWSR